jgi:hypothetical protein
MQKQEEPQIVSDVKISPLTLDDNNPIPYYQVSFKLTQEAKQDMNSIITDESALLGKQLSKEITNILADRYM